jgi:hypothetical protein
MRSPFSRGKSFAESGPACEMNNLVIFTVHEAAT